jgi:sarcosine oxidase
MDERGVPYEVLDTAAVHERWPQLVLPDGTLTLYQARTGMAPAARGVAAMQRSALAAGAVLRGDSPVTAVRDRGSQGIEVDAGETTYRVRRLVVTADAWTNDVLGHLDHNVPLTVTQEQVTYFAAEKPERFAPDRFPVWIWMDDPSFYGFPTYGEAGPKSAEDVGGDEVTPATRTFERNDVGFARLTEFLACHLPEQLGPEILTKTCLYTLTPDRDFVVDRLPDHPGVHVVLGAAHAYGSACYRQGGCSDIIAAVADRIDARAFNPAFPMVFPRFVQHAIRRYCAQSGLAVCNGNRIDDRKSCDNVYCQMHSICDRTALYNKTV